MPKLGIRRSALATELVVVFVGLFGALQLDNWREGRALDLAETAYLHRLEDDLGRSLANIEGLLEVQVAREAAVLHVQASFEAGHIIRGDSTLFEDGLVFVAHLPVPTLFRSTYDEMVASGMYSRLQSEELKQALSGLYAFDQNMQTQFAWWRESGLDASDLLEAALDYYTDGPGEAGIRARYDFEELVSNRALRGRYFWAADTHSDWVRMISRLARLTRTTHALLETELEAR
jgi:hypothetical protein